MKHIFILNPVAGKGKTLKLIPSIKEAFDGRKEELLIETTKRRGHATEIARRHSGKEDCRIYSVGGDGTVNEVLNGMAESNCVLAVIPAGSGNDFIKSIDNSRNFEDIIRRTVQGSTKILDLGLANGRYFINIASVGFDAEVVYNTEKFKKLPFISGSLAYIIALVTTVFSYTSLPLKINIDGVHLSEECLLTAVANGRYYGGGMIPAPEAVPDDGQFDICVVKKMSKLKILGLFPKFIKGRHGSIREVSFYKGRRIEIECRHVMSINVDGEVDRVNKVVFELLAGKIRVVVP